MEEGERLSIKQGNMESTIKKLRGQIKELEASQAQSAARLAAEEAKLEAVTKARQKAEAAVAAAQQQHKADVEQQKLHYEALLKQAQALQVTRDVKVHGIAVLPSFVSHPIKSCSMHPSFCRAKSPTPQHPRPPRPASLRTPLQSRCARPWPHCFSKPDIPICFGTRVAVRCPYRRLILVTASTQAGPG